jgi:foldase protein PrsA
VKVCIKKRDRQKMPVRKEHKMKRLTKRITALALGLVLAVSALTGCSSSVKPETYDTTVVATLGDEKIYLDEAVMYLRFDQNYYEMMYSYFYGSTDIWDMEVQTGLTMEDNLKNSEMQVLRQIYILCSHAEEMGVALSEADEAAIEESVDSILSSSSTTLLESIGMSRDRMIEVYEKNALANLVYQAVVAQIDTEVSEDEIRCVGVSYVMLAVSSDSDEDSTETEEDENVQSPETTMETIYRAVEDGTSLEEAAAVYDLTPVETTFFVGDTYDEGSLGATALSMEEGECQLIQIEGDGWYLIQLDTLRDEDATESMRESILSDREDALFEEVYSQWQEESPSFSVVSKVWKAVPMTTVYGVDEETEAETEIETETTVETTEESAEETVAETETSEN